MVLPCVVVLDRYGGMFFPVRWFLFLRPAQIRLAKPNDKDLDEIQKTN